MKRALQGCLIVAGSLFAATVAQAHISVSGPAFAGATHEASFGVGHGCDGADTYRVKVQIPAGVTSVRPMDSTFGKAVLEKDAEGNVTAVVWTKPIADVLPEDTSYYKLSLRFKVPETPFKTLYFPTVQTCRTADGTETIAEWVDTSGDHGSHGEDPGGAESLPAPALTVLPPRAPGWNKYTVNEHVHDLSVFKDALIVWAGKAAYSPNPSTQSLIETEPDTEVLTMIHPGTEIWVKY
ncbi:YcnI family copper-binding membrane protein [Sorangium sp. So ce1335]|uniref:YcnI family copper-binding membrane protein n=1 Tax=Sorangium sp. So ce1335 TaxID=3133335 RepID=UPI003F5EF9FA